MSVRTLAVRQNRLDSRFLHKLSDPTISGMDSYMKNFENTTHELTELYKLEHKHNIDRSKHTGIVKHTLKKLSPNKRKRKTRKAIK